MTETNPAMSPPINRAAAKMVPQLPKIKDSRNQTIMASTAKANTFPTEHPPFFQIVPACYSAVRIAASRSLNSS